MFVKSSSDRSHMLLAAESSYKWCEGSMLNVTDSFLIHALFSFSFFL